MNFDLSKENIQPLRGGRNVSQLDVALQAQTNQEYQRELQQQRQEFERLISEYTGSDPLENWYNYISWIEQSYPKHGHEGNLLPLLEQCLAKFEHDKRYMNDRRFCKLWIKYIDSQKNPIELYHMMHARGLGRGCADLYKAWAYYHEAAGDFQNANHIFECGKRELAQPYEELEIAHKNLIMAAGRHMLYGADEQKLFEKRQALTSLHSYKHGRVGSIRQPINLENPNLVTMSTTSTSNVPINIYNGSDEILSGSEAPPISLLLAAKRDDITKEDTLKPGMWTTMPAKKRPKPPTSGGLSNFTIHEDADNKPPFPAYTLEVFTDWIVSLTLPEPKDPKIVPMYPKNRVYSQMNTEYSLEELRSLKYLKKFEPNFTLVQQEQEVNKVDSLPKSQLINNSGIKQAMEQQSEQVSVIKTNSFVNNKNSMLISLDVWNSPSLENSMNPSLQQQQEQLSQTQRNATKFTIYEQTNLGIPETNIDMPKISAMKTPFNDLYADELAETGSRGGMDIAAAAPVDSAKRLSVFDDDTTSSSNRSFDDDFGQQQQQQDFADLSCNTQIFNFNLNKMHVSTPQSKLENNNHIETIVGKASCKQLFSDRVPLQEKALSTIMEETKNFGSSSSSAAATKSFNNHTRPNNMAAISEEHHSYLAQNLKANAELRSSLLGNLMDLDTQPSLPLTTTKSPIIMTVSEANNSIQSDRQSPPTTTTTTTKITPIDYIPSDPFKPALIKHLLKLVGFPGQHTRGYYQLNTIPRLQVRKETITIGPDKYVLEKELGKGTYGTVFRGVDLKNGQTVALKYQKAVNEWEFYICRELQSRLNDHYLRDRFMDVRTGYFSDQASLLVSQFMPCGSLLDVANTIKQKRGRGMKESLCIYFCIEMLNIVQAMHSVKIIHADIKPDNFLIQLFPDNKVGLQLIDFGCSIDMSLLPQDASFTRPVTTENFVCCEMLDGLPWNYHTDLFCVAATAHVLLFEKYIHVQKRDGLWSINQHMPRYLRLDLWNTFFSTLLNQQRGPADSEQLQTILEDSLKQKNDEYQIELRYFLNILKNR